MYLIANSSFTQCDWILLDKAGDFILKTQTANLNPDKQTTQTIRKRLAKSEEIAHVKDDVKEIYFFGLGGGLKKNKVRLDRFFKKYFKRATCEVHGHILGACLAVTKKPGIVCILGTGSNACFFDGKTDKTCAISLGYKVMDEASANYFGKQLLRDYFYKKMPPELAKSFKMQFDLRPHIIETHLYQKENANAYLASFAKFMFERNPLPSYFKTMVSNGFDVFLENHVLCFPEAKSVPINFVGSVAYPSMEIIKERIAHYHLTLGNTVERPIDGLAKYFQEKIKANTEKTTFSLSRKRSPSL